MTENFGITSPGTIRRRKTPPDGHTERCWLKAQAHSRRGSSDDFAITNVVALDGLRGGGVACTCGK